MAYESNSVDAQGTTSGMGSYEDNLGRRFRNLEIGMASLHPDADVDAIDYQYSVNTVGNYESTLGSAFRDLQQEIHRRDSLSFSESLSFEECHPSVESFKADLGKKSSLKKSTKKEVVTIKKKSNPELASILKKPIEKQAGMIKKKSNPKMRSSSKNSTKKHADTIKKKSCPKKVTPEENVATGDKVATNEETAPIIAALSHTITEDYETLEPNVELIQYENRVFVGCHIPSSPPKPEEDVEAENCKGEFRAWAKLSEAAAACFDSIPEDETNFEPNVELIQHGDRIVLGYNTPSTSPKPEDTEANLSRIAYDISVMIDGAVRNITPVVEEMVSNGKKSISRSIARTHRINNVIFDDERNDGGAQVGKSNSVDVDGQEVRDQ